jgi:hypothetical protein
MNMSHHSHTDQNVVISTLLLNMEDRGESEGENGNDERKVGEIMNIHVITHET